jgi:hypothetical protein
MCKSRKFCTIKLKKIIGKFKEEILKDELLKQMLSIPYVYSCTAFLI